MVGLGIKKGARAGTPSCAVVINVVQLVEKQVITVEDKHVTIGLTSEIDIARGPALDPVRLGDCFIRNGVKGIGLLRGVVYPIGLISIIKCHSLLLLVGVDGDVWKAISLDTPGRGVSSEIRMEPFGPCAVYEVDEIGRFGICRSGADVEVPPVVEGKQWLRERTTEDSHAGINSVTDHEPAAEQHLPHRLNPQDVPYY